MTQIYISNENIRDEILNAAPNFPKYTTQILNLANQNAQGTRPKIVGQMSELIQECPSKKYDEWVDWYSEQKPDAIDDATEKVFEMVKKLKIAIDQIDEKMIRRWVTDLVLTKTYVGLCFQESILNRIAKDRTTTYRLATPLEESQGIDGYIGNEPVSIKPISYKTKKMLPEEIKVKVIYYKKDKNGILIEY